MALPLFVIALSGADTRQDVPRLAWLVQHLDGAPLARIGAGWPQDPFPALAVSYLLPIAALSAVLLPDPSAPCRRCGGSTAA
jgi:hypothetical protein